MSNEPGNPGDDQPNPFKGTPFEQALRDARRRWPPRRGEPVRARRRGGLPPAACSP
ncbi:hypothetical protein [Nocardioides convexus]|uniref:hypothetical protein n=1 Tax=Nocardioides convexus TaxID=2712224 RepID=UPI0024185328|nr:hypothetical protein [Nocardioides convexus]